MSADIVNRLRLIGARGLGKVVGGEMSRLSRRAFSDLRLPRPKKQGDGVVWFPFDERLAVLAARFHRTSSRVVWDLYSSSATRLEPLYAEIRELAAADERDWTRGRSRFSLRPRNLGGFAAGERQVVGAVKNALVEGRNQDLQVDPANPELLLDVSLHDDTVTVSLDLTGWPRHRRGYRVGGGGEAPIRETLASAMVMLSRFDARSELFIDPTCGSGTIAIEAALMSRAEPVFADATMADALFGAGLAPSAALFADAKPAIWASDISHGAVALARRNAEQAGVADDIHFAVSDFYDLQLDAIRQAARAPDKMPVVVSNLPYGLRIGGEELAGMYEDLSQWLGGMAGGRSALLVANDEFEAVFPDRPLQKKPLSNGQVRAYFYLHQW